MNESEDNLIIDLQKMNSLSGDEAHQYWFHRFQGLAYEDDQHLRDAISELEKLDFLMISLWADNIPWLAELTERGKKYSRNKVLLHLYGLPLIKWLFGFITMILAGVLTHLLTK